MKTKLLKRIRKRFEYRFETNPGMVKYVKVVFWDKKNKTSHDAPSILRAVEWMQYTLVGIFYTSADTLTKQRLRRRNFINATGGERKSNFKEIIDQMMEDAKREQNRNK